MQNLYVLLRQFEVIGGVERIGQPGFCLLMALWRRSNELGWRNTFTMSNTELKCKGGFSSDKTLIGARGKLMEQGFIKYARPNKSGKCGMYILNFDLLSLSGLQGSNDGEYYLEEEEDLSEAPWENCGEEEENSPNHLPKYEPEYLPNHIPNDLPDHAPEYLPGHLPKYLPNHLPKDDKKVSINILDYTRPEKTITDNNNNNITDSNNYNNSYNIDDYKINNTNSSDNINSNGKVNSDKNSESNSDSHSNNKREKNSKGNNTSNSKNNNDNNSTSNSIVSKLKKHEDEVFIKTMEHYCKRAKKIETSLKPKERQAMYEISKKMPLEVILTGIDMAFDNFKKSGEAERINSFIYCEKVINALWINKEQGLKGERPNGKSKGGFAGGENGEIKIHSSGIGLSL
ncbi:hypothetical protein [Hathewaya massiliensis]|uniref:hypothetical protein n=1 Tax=Hathewaya massiliensis TaxID=1964382 RepID=UPI00115A5F46|nr:hypothetical protein [Hathewaya massiliensis]